MPNYGRPSNPNRSLAQALLDHGADANTTVSYTPVPGPLDWISARLQGRMPPRRIVPRSLLEHAIAVGNVPIATALLNHGADPNYCRENGSTLLFLAAKKPELEIARELIRHGARINARNAYKETALHFASGDVARLLIDSGADIQARTVTGQTPLHRAACSWTRDVLGEGPLHSGTDPLPPFGCCSIAARTSTPGTTRATRH